VSSERSVGEGRRARAPVPAPRSKLPLILGGVVVLAALVAGVIFLMGGSEEKRRVAEEADYKDPPAVTAETLAKAFRANRVATDTQYKTRVVAVSGVVSRKESLEGAYGSGTQHVVFLAGVEGLEIDGRIDPAHAAPVAALKTGDKVTLVGRYAGEGAGGQVLVLRNTRLK
jgi:hypothetical protein